MNPSDPLMRSPFSPSVTAKGKWSGHYRKWAACRGGSLSVKKTIVTFFWVVANDWVSDQTGRDLQGIGCANTIFEFPKIGILPEMNYARRDG